MIAFVSFAYGILLGLVAATILFLVEYGRVDSVRFTLTGKDYQSTFDVSDERQEALRKFGDAILIIQLQGFIFFGTADRLRKTIESRISGSRDDAPVRFLLIDFQRVTGIDSSTVLSFTRLDQFAIAREFLDRADRAVRPCSQHPDSRRHRRPRPRLRSTSSRRSTTG